MALSGIYARRFRIAPTPKTYERYGYFQEVSSWPRALLCPSGGGTGISLVRPPFLKTVSGAVGLEAVSSYGDRVFVTGGFTG